MNEKDIREIFAQSDLNVSDIDIDETENIANVYIEVSSTLEYTIEIIETITKKIKDIRTILIQENLINDMTFGDLYQGIWRILIEFNAEQNEII